MPSLSRQHTSLAAILTKNPTTPFSIISRCQKSTLPPEQTSHIQQEHNRCFFLNFQAHDALEHLLYRRQIRIF